jgi:hypothetical protein
VLSIGCIRFGLGPLCIVVVSVECKGGGGGGAGKTHPTTNPPADVEVTWGCCCPAAEVLPPGAAVAAPEGAPAAAAAGPPPPPPPRPAPGYKPAHNLRASLRHIVACDILSHLRTTYARSAHNLGAKRACDILSQVRYLS